MGAQYQWQRVSRHGDARDARSTAGGQAHEAGQAAGTLRPATRTHSPPTSSASSSASCSSAGLRACRSRRLAQQWCTWGAGQRQRGGAGGRWDCWPAAGIAPAHGACARTQHVLPAACMHAGRQASAIKAGAGAPHLCNGLRALLIDHQARDARLGQPHPRARAQAAAAARRLGAALGLGRALARGGVGGHAETG